MPRITTSDADSLDFCKECFTDSQTAHEVWGDIGNAANENGNCFEYDSPHPPYEDTNYSCHECDKPLTKKDN